MSQLLARFLPRLFRFTSAGGLGFTMSGYVVGGLLAIGVALYATNKVQSYIDLYQLKTDCSIVQDSLKESTKQVNKARADHAEAKRVIESDNFDNDFLLRLQQQSD